MPQDEHPTLSMLMSSHEGAHDELTHLTIHAIALPSDSKEVEALQNSLLGTPVPIEDAMELADGQERYVAPAALVVAFGKLLGFDPLAVSKALQTVLISDPKVDDETLRARALDMIAQTGSAKASRVVRELLNRQKRLT